MRLCPGKRAGRINLHTVFKKCRVEVGFASGDARKLALINQAARPSQRQRGGYTAKAWDHKENARTSWTTHEDSGKRLDPNVAVAVIIEALWKRNTVLMGWTKPKPSVNMNRNHKPHTKRRES